MAAGLSSASAFMFRSRRLPELNVDDFGHGRKAVSRAVVGGAAVALVGTACADGTAISGVPVQLT